ncbi:hypothetical protein [Bradyrhizobium sp. USDA 10063]
MSKHFSWKAGCNRNLLLSKIASARNIQNGQCSFNAGDYEFWLPVLSSAIQAAAAAEPLKDRCITQSLSDASVTLNNPDAFLLRCDDAYASLSKRPKSTFVLYTTITYSGPKLIESIVEGPHRISWPSKTAKLVRKATEARKSLEFYRTARKIASEGEELTPLLAYVSGYDASDAFETANDCIDRFRGMVNLLVNSTNAIHPLGGLAPPHAINRVRRGPMHTLHRPDGSLATETFWYEPRWDHNQPTVKFASDVGRKLRGWWNKLQDNPMKDFVGNALLRYCRALDLHEADAALLGLWQVLEKMTGTDRYDQLISRISRLFRDHEEAREIANHLRIRRNQTVHSAHNISREAHVILHQAEVLAGQILFFCIKNGAKFSSQAELVEFLDLPLDLTKLTRHQQLVDYFMRYQNRP